jgi:hypothetical protein
MAAEEIQSADLRERFDLIESMLNEGRRSTQYWGWMFVLWGIGYMVAIAGSYLGGTVQQYCWPVVMVGTAGIGVLVGRGKQRGQPETVKSRALSSIWAAVGTSIFVFAFSAAFSGHNELHIFLAGIMTLIGVAHAASSLFLKWGLQMAVALVWWTAAVACCYVRTDQLVYFLIAANVIGNLCFGSYLMYAEARDRKRLVHA